MPREIFTLSDATRDTLTDNVKPVSGVMAKSDKYFYAILSEDKTDPFAPFESLYKGVLRAGLSTCHWDNHLEFVRSRFAPKKAAQNPASCFSEKMNFHSQTLSRFIEAFADGEFDEEEIKSIEECLNKEEGNLGAIRAMLNFRKTLLNK